MLKGGQYGRQLTLSKEHGLSYIHYRKPKSNGHNIVLLRNGRVIQEHTINRPLDEIHNILRRVVARHHSKSRSPKRISGGVSSMNLISGNRYEFKGRALEGSSSLLKVGVLRKFMADYVRSVGGDLLFNFNGQKLFIDPSDTTTFEQI